MGLELRDYQVDLYAEARELRRKGAKSILLQLPTGGGKTRIAAELLRNCVAKGFNAWFLCHRREILKQTTVTLYQAGVPASIVAAGVPINKLAQVQVCSIQTMVRRYNQLARPHLIIVDECHHIIASSWSLLIAAFPDAVLIGLSATPERLDGAGLGKYFQHLLVGPSTRTLIEQGWLSPYRFFAPGHLDMTGVEIVAGDFNKKQVDQKMRAAAVTGDALFTYTKHVNGKRAIAFAWSVESSIELAAKFNKAGIPAAHIDGGTDERTRDRIIDMFREGRILFLSNVDIVSEGFDLPGCDAGFFLRPTQSLTLHLQQIGRTLRYMPGKVAYLFDHAGNCRRLGLPDDDREWTLDVGKKRKKKKVDDEDACRVCPECSEAHPMNVRVCTCGYPLIQSRTMDIDEHTELTEIDAQQLRLQRMQEQSSARDLESLIRFGKSKGYKNPFAWAKFVLRAREEKAAAKAARRVLARTEPPPDVDGYWLF